MKSINDYILESINKDFTPQEKEIIIQDIWNKNGQFQDFIKDKVDYVDEDNIKNYLEQCIDDDRCTAEMASYIEMIINRNNFTIEQVQNFIYKDILK